MSLYRASCLDGDYDTSPSWGSALEPAGGAGRTAWLQVALAWTNDDSHDMCIYIYSIYIVCIYGTLGGLRSNLDLATGVLRSSLNLAIE